MASMGKKFVSNAAAALRLVNQVSHRISNEDDAVSSTFSLTDEERKVRISPMQ